MEEPTIYAKYLQQYQSLSTSTELIKEHSTLGIRLHMLPNKTQSLPSVPTVFYLDESDDDVDTPDELFHGNTEDVPLEGDPFPQEHVPPPMAQNPEGFGNFLETLNPNQGVSDSGDIARVDTLFTRAEEFSDWSSEYDSDDSDGPNFKGYKVAVVTPEPEMSPPIFLEDETTSSVIKVESLGGCGESCELLDSAMTPESSALEDVEGNDPVAGDRSSARMGANFAANWSPESSNDVSTRVEVFPQRSVEETGPIHEIHVMTSTSVKAIAPRRYLITDPHCSLYEIEWFPDADNDFCAVEEEEELEDEEACGGGLARDHPLATGQLNLEVDGGEATWGDAVPEQSEENESTEKENGVTGNADEASTIEIGTSALLLPEEDDDPVRILDAISNVLENLLGSKSLTAMSTSFDAMVKSSTARMKDVTAAMKKTTEIMQAHLEVLAQQNEVKDQVSSVVNPSDQVKTLYPVRNILKAEAEDRKRPIKRIHDELFRANASSVNRPNVYSTDCRQQSYAEGRGKSGYKGDPQGPGSSRGPGAINAPDVPASLPSTGRYSGSSRIPRPTERIDRSGAKKTNTTASPRKTPKESRPPRF